MIDIIDACKEIVDQHINTKKANDNGYNIYKILHVTNKEVQMCRILADFLDPDGSHGEGSKYLREFFRVVLRKDVSVEILKDARVYKEYPITNDRRIDIVISYRGGFIPIEVKINVGDQKSQCYDYYQFASAKDKDTSIVYLTKTGYMPSTYSLIGESGAKLDDKNLLCISFDKDILSWLEIIKGIAKEDMIPFIEQFIGAVKDFINGEDKEYKMKLTEKIIENSDSLRTALELEKTINYAKAELMKKLFAEFEKQMAPVLELYNLEIETRSGWFYYEYQTTEDFYAHNKSTYPGLNYVVKSVDLGENLSLWLRIEVDNRLFASLCVFDYASESDTGYEIGNRCDEISDDIWNKICEQVMLPAEKGRDGWIVTWKYLPTGSDSTHDAIDNVPDFKKMNEAAVALADEEIRREFVAKSINKIEDTLLALIKKKE